MARAVAARPCSVSQYAGDSRVVGSGFGDRETHMGEETSPSEARLSVRCHGVERKAQLISSTRYASR